ncbi:hypothetical protein E1A91_A13G246600v1 [Gossypium mustelinum]|uniref:Uncharacterized protein n=1 Tax=Gossypium mustelinum TaxID=34275 RepID=A0A5D2WM18_GOSMU|nr:hypothetical protein E1A91_A13G246600v1 [Gossypium mustelinum]
MKDRGKAVEVYNGSSSSSDFVCKKHPQLSSNGICAYCLKDRLVKLVCSDCGEQRLSSCSCSEISSNPRTSCTGEVGSVGRVSFLIENESKDQLLKGKINGGGEDKGEDGNFFLKRSNSSCVEIKRKNGLWRLGRLFRKKREKYNGGNVKSVDYNNGVSRSRSLCSFRGGNGGGFFGSDDGSMNFSAARSSSISAARSSSVNGGLLGMDPDRKSGFSEPEPRKSGFDSDKRDSAFVECDVATDIKALRKAGGVFLDNETGFSTANRRVFSLKETYFTGGDDSAFIDLKFEFPSYDTLVEPGGSKSVQKGFASDGVSMFGGGGSCRVSVDERGIKRSRKSFKGWKWIFKNNNPDWSGNRKKGGGDLMVNH